MVSTNSNANFTYMAQISWYSYLYGVADLSAIIKSDKIHVWLRISKVFHLVLEVVWFPKVIVESIGFYWLLLSLLLIVDSVVLFNEYKLFTVVELEILH